MNLGQALLTSLIVVPGLTATYMGLGNWFDLRRTEESTSRLTNLSFGTLVLLSLASCVVNFSSESRTTFVEFPWFGVEDYHFGITLVADWISTPLSALFAILSATIGVFSRRYLHREPGYQRFYFLLGLFTFGVQLTVLAGSLDIVFIGWELVGLCSALLIAYFHDRRKPVEHAIRAFFTYRLCDVGLLSAVVWIHHTVGTTDFEYSQRLHGFGLPTPSSASDVALIGLLALVAAIGKGGQAPLGGWLPRAMEGPTPSSAIFYGAISVHLAPFLLLRMAPLLAESTLASTSVLVVGAITAIHGTFVGRVQSDVKSMLAYASMTQVGLILVEIGAGLHVLALVHLMGHASLRSLQILMSPNALAEHQLREQALGSTVPRTGGHLERVVPRALQPWLYRHALERGYFDAVLRDFVLAPFVRAFRWLDSAERHFTSWIEGPPQARTSPKPAPPEPRVAPDGVR